MQPITTMTPPSEYWASLDTDRLPAAITERINRYVNYVQMTGRDRIWRRAMRMFYGRNDRGDSSHGISFAGMGESLRLRVNLFRFYMQARFVLIGGSWPSLQVRPSADDSRANDQVITGNALIDDYSNRLWKRILGDALRFSGLYGEGHIYEYWDHYSGNPYAIGPDGETIYEGALECVALAPDAVIRDPDVRDFRKHEWLIIRLTDSRYKLAARYPDLATKILQTGRDENWRGIEISDEYELANGWTDQIPIYVLLHRSNDAMPGGRRAMCIGETIVFDEPLDTPEIPVRSVIPDQEKGRGLGYGDSWDLMSPQEMIDSIASVMASVRENFGAIDIWTEPNSNLEATDLAPGFRHIESVTKPEAIMHAVGYVAEAVGAMDTFDRFIKQGAKVSDVMTGDAASSASGKSLMAQQASAQQANSDAQAVYMTCIQDVASLGLYLVKKYQTVERMLPIVGRLKEPSVKRFKGADLDSLEGVQIELSSPFLNTAAGRKDTADNLLQRGVINAEQYFDVAITGRPEPASRREQEQIALIERENELMAKGTPTKVAITDNHPKHIREHSCEMDDPEVRNDDARIQILSDHLLEHDTQWLNMPLSLCMALGIPPHPNAPPPMPIPMPGQNPNTPDAMSPNALPPNPQGGPTPDMQAPTPNSMGAPSGGEMGLPEDGMSTGSKVGLPAPALDPTMQMT